uniref:Uncharacterized protein n=1 Tax=Branchiostoma floridae TaxID=7739 RepID=C3YM94_BRAFL|eukprot:XP_002602676.1 hypothetical protein BRAFLDRAFT_57967 [Branchiostoma floridae]
MHEALVKRGEDFSSRPDNPIVKLTNPNRIGIIWAPFGTPWKEHRKFTLMSLREFGFGKRSLEGKILEESVALQAEILKMRNKPFDISRMIQNAVVNVICSIVFGCRFEYNDDKFTRLMDALDQVVSSNIFGQLAIFFPILRRVPGMGRGVQVIIDGVGNVKAFIREEMSSHKKTFDSNDIRDLIDSYVRKTKSRENEDETTFTDEYTERALYDLFLAGSESTSTTLYWAFLHMILNPDIQKKAQEEIHSVLGHDKSPSTAHRAQMPYTEAVLTEVARIGTIAPTSFFHATSRDTSFRGYHIPEGMTVVQVDGGHLNTKKKKNLLQVRACASGSSWQRWSSSCSSLPCFTFKLPEGAAKPTTTGINGITHSPKNFELVAEPLA